MRWTGTCEVLRTLQKIARTHADITELRRLERELTAAQKLESVGRLAAGVAHEINTPVQFVSDNVQFVRRSLTDHRRGDRGLSHLRQSVEAGGDVAAAAHAPPTAETAPISITSWRRMPLAIDSAIDGLGRIATIVRSMKEFAHPDEAQKTAADLNQAIQSTLVISRNEYKYVAELETEFGELPPVQCYLGEINQVVLNLHRQRGACDWRCRQGHRALGQAHGAHASRRR